MRYVALVLGDGSSWWVRAVDAPSMEKARRAVDEDERRKDEDRRREILMFTTSQTERLKNALERCESKRRPDVVG